VSAARVGSGEGRGRPQLRMLIGSFVKVGVRVKLLQSSRIERAILARAVYLYPWSGHENM